MMQNKGRIKARQISRRYDLLWPRNAFEVDAVAQHGVMLETC